MDDAVLSGLDAGRWPVGSPWQNAWIESFNARLRDELLNIEQFDTLLEAKVLIEDWRVDYNTRRPTAPSAGSPPTTTPKPGPAIATNSHNEWTTKLDQATALCVNVDYRRFRRSSCPGLGSTAAVGGRKLDSAITASRRGSEPGRLFS